MEGKVSPKWLQETGSISIRVVYVVWFVDDAGGISSFQFNEKNLAPSGLKNGVNFGRLGIGPARLVFVVWRANNIEFSSMGVAS